MLAQQNVSNNNLKQPAALPILFLVEMWERFGFYIVQGILVLYLTQAFGFSDEKSYSITGAFTAFVYLSPIIGGYLADRILGFKLAIVLGGILFFIGYGALAVLSRDFLYISLAIIIVANGFFKPNISSLLGTLYQTDDPRREAGFTIFYIGINVGSMAATFFGGFVKQYFGWEAGFALASLGLLIGLFTYFIGRKRLEGYGEVPKEIPATNRFSKWVHSKYAIFIGILLAIAVFSELVQNKNLANGLLFITGFFLLITLLVIAFKQPSRLARNKLIALIVLFLASIAFWAVWFQIFFSLNLFVERDINRHAFGIEIPTMVFISLEPLYIIITGPLLARLWEYLSLKGKNPSIGLKFCLSLFITCISFLLLSWGTHFHDAQNLFSPWWIVGSYFLLTIGEMLLSPIGLSAVTVLAPSQLVGFIMGIWLITLGFGGKFAGVIAGFSSIPEGITDHLIEAHYYGSAFFLYAMIALLFAVIMLCLVPVLRKLIQENNP